MGKLGLTQDEKRWAADLWKACMWACEPQAQDDTVELDHEQARDTAALLKKVLAHEGVTVLEK